MTCCPVTADGVCGGEAGRGECASVNFDRHSNDTTNVRVNWSHYHTRICKCNGNFGGYDCSRCKYTRILRSRLRFESNHSSETCAGVQQGRMAGVYCHHKNDQDLGVGLQGCVRRESTGNCRPEHDQCLSVWSHTHPTHGWSALMTSLCCPPNDIIEGLEYIF